MSAGEEDGASGTKTPTVDPDEILVRQIKAVSYTHLTLPTIYSV